MNKVWTTEDLKTLRTELMVKSDIHDVAATLDRPVCTENLIRID